MVRFFYAENCREKEDSYKLKMFLIIHQRRMKMPVAITNLLLLRKLWSLMCFLCVSRSYAYNDSTGMATTARKLYLMASGSLKLSRLCIALWEPHPGHFNPVRCRKGHLGNQLLSAGLKRMYIKIRDIASIAASNIPKYLGIFDLQLTNNRSPNN